MKLDHRVLPRFRLRPWSPRRSQIGEAIRLAIFALVVTSLVGSALAFRWSSVPSLRENDVATATIKAPHTFTFISEVRTEEARREAAQDPSTIQLRLEPAVAEEQVRLQGQATDEITRIRQDASLSIMARLDALRKLSTVLLTEEQANELLNLDDTQWSQVAREARTVLVRALERQVLPEEVHLMRNRLRDWIAPNFTEGERSIIVALAAPFVRANVVVDTQATERNRQRARDEVQPVRVTVQQGEVIVRDGSIVTAADLEKLEQLGLRDRGPSLPEVAGTFGLVALLIGILLGYMVVFQPEVWRGSNLVLVGAVLVVSVVVGRLLFPIHPLLPYAFPIAVAAMLLAVLLDAHLAMAVGMLLSLLLGLVGENSLELAVLYFTTALVSALIMWRADRSARFLTAGLAVAVVTVVVTLSFGLSRNNLDPPTTLTIVGLAVLNGVLSAGLTFVAFSLLGSVFGVTTVLQLLELAHPNQPLLRRLAREAPGTYHHSIVVSSLAENAAELVGGDPLFTRVAVYYHDIGKVLRPYFFIENQVNRENIHDSLDPKTSASIILGHVTDGVALAKRHRLPKRIIDIIQQHHGTTRVQYFYQRALERGDVVDPQDFTYPGPRPQSKEAGIIMLADAVETTVRAQAQAGKFRITSDDLVGDDVGSGAAPTDKIAEVVDRIINERLADGQLDDCELTLKDIGQIRAAFAGVLSNIYHPRIEYPSAPKTAEPAAEPVAP